MMIGSSDLRSESEERHGLGICLIDDVWPISYEVADLKRLGRVVLVDIRLPS